MAFWLLFNPRTTCGFTIHCRNGVLIANTAGMSTSVDLGKVRSRGRVRVMKHLRHRWLSKTGGDNIRDSVSSRFLSFFVFCEPLFDPFVSCSPWKSCGFWYFYLAGSPRFLAWVSSSSTKVLRSIQVRSHLRLG